MYPDNAQHFSLNLALAVDKVYQRNILSRQIFDALEVLFYFNLIFQLKSCELNISCTSTTAESRAKIWYQ